MRFHDKNYGKSPFDPDYVEDYDSQEDYEDYLQSIEDRYEFRRENR